MTVLIHFDSGPGGYEATFAVCTLLPLIQLPMLRLSMETAPSAGVWHWGRRAGKMSGDPKPLGCQTVHPYLI